MSSSSNTRNPGDELRAVGPMVQLAAARARRSGQAHHEGIILSLSKDEASG